VKLSLVFNNVCPRSLKYLYQILTVLKGPPLSNNNIDQQFTLFPKCPPELRRKIWYATFEGHVVSFDIRSFIAGAYYDDRVALPIALSINKESRTEALLHYRIIPPLPSRPKFRFICINPALDSVTINYFGAILKPKCYNEFFSYIEGQ